MHTHNIKSVKLHK